MIVIMIIGAKTKRIKKLHKKKQRVKKYKSKSKSNKPSRYYSESDLTPE